MNSSRTSLRYIASIFPSSSPHLRQNLENLALQLKQNEWPQGITVTGFFICLAQRSQFNFSPTFFFKLNILIHLTKESVKFPIFKILDYLIF